MLILSQLKYILFCRVFTDANIFYFFAYILFTCIFIHIETLPGFTDEVTYNVGFNLCIVLRAAVRDTEPVSKVISERPLTFTYKAQ